MRLRSATLRVVAVLVMSFASSLFALSVSAHAEVLTATPAQGSTVSEPVARIVVTYSEALTADSRLGIYDANNDRIAVGVPDPADDHRAVATLDPALTSGTYTVKSTSISAGDGDIDRQQWTFTVNVPASIAPTTQASGGPSESPSPTGAPSATAAPSPSAAPTTPTNSGSDAVVPVIAALAIVALGGVFLMTRSRRSGTGR